jgi:uncharacterized protein YbgA (DUF1722 family)
LIEDHRQRLLSLIVPLMLLKHHLNRHPVPDWVYRQVYLHPYPRRLGWSKSSPGIGLRQRP